MTTDVHLALMERMRSGPLGGGSGAAPDCSLVELGSGVDGPGPELDQLVAVFTEHWGGPQLVSLWSTGERARRGEEIPQPWHLLSGSVEYVHLWRTEDRWILLGSPSGGERPDVVAVATVVDPP
ncbi:hypothetical protein [Streptomyces sp. NPDC060194]|uniref:hypothetical protein n=1 Tax=Streptomyces sp. NPDC060194 TaxID=3347069 RepID=UPI003657B664